MRYAARVDANQADIVKALRKAGAIVTPMHQHGQGVPDLLISYRNRWYLMEVKREGEKPNELQRRWISEQVAPVLIATGPTEAVAMLTAPVDQGGEWIYGMASTLSVRSHVCEGPDNNESVDSIKVKAERRSLSDRVLESLRFSWRAGRKMTVDELCERLLVSKSSKAIGRALRHLIQGGLVRRDGNNRTAMYWAEEEK